MKELILNDGNKIPIIGFGTYKSNEQDGVQSVIDALAHGYRLIDTAAKYENEASVGKGIKMSNVDRKDIAEKHTKSVSQICLRWVIQHNVVVIPKSTTLKRIKENINLFDFELSEEEMIQIDNLPEMGFSGELPHIWPNRIDVRE